LQQLAVQWQSAGSPQQQKTSSAGWVRVRTRSALASDADSAVSSSNAIAKRGTRLIRSALPSDPRYD
jgi:hypothetical protein